MLPQCKMKNLIIIIGTILLGVLIVDNLILGDTNSLKSAAEGIMEKGTNTISSAMNFDSMMGG
ncbi:MAG: hypothetical protein PUE18_05080 [Firmicutes bacterium]|nr:hypothetical protein [Bacillota bacterium]